MRRGQLFNTKDNADGCLISRITLELWDLKGPDPTLVQIGCKYPVLVLPAGLYSHHWLCQVCRGCSIWRGNAVGFREWICMRAPLMAEENGHAPPGWSSHPAVWPETFQAAFYKGKGVAAPRNTGCLFSPWLQRGSRD